MANYVYNMIICPVDAFYRYFFDTDPFGNGEQTLFMSFNKLFDVKNIREYMDKIGTPISYGYGGCLTWQSPNQCVLKFQTRSYYPIEAIIKSIELNHDIEWFATEENEIYVSKFYWKNWHVKENVLHIEDEYNTWVMNNAEFDYALFEENEADCSVWYFLRYCKKEWHEWQSEDGFSRYRNFSAFEVRYPFND